MYTIGKLATQYRLSRSTLLYYNSIGLLQPTDRSNANYRLYSEENVQRLEKIKHLQRVYVPIRWSGIEALGASNKRK